MWTVPGGPFLVDLGPVVLQAEAGDIVLLFGDDESEALTHPYRKRGLGTLSPAA